MKTIKTIKYVLGCISSGFVFLRQKQLDHIVYKRIQKQIGNKLFSSLIFKLKELFNLNLRDPQELHIRLTMVLFKL